MCRMGHSLVDSVSAITAVPLRCQRGVDVASVTSAHHYSAKATATAFPGGIPGLTPTAAPTSASKSLLKNPLEKQKPICEKRDPRCADPAVYQAKTPLGQCCREHATEALQKGLSPVAPTPALLQVSLHEWRGKGLGGFL
mmetsp:Transcript_74938/g.139848  ORF Transcript_74938/g.139848 Transcript_74938/m.139848 type:complete len:140 (-) Transcript_74938:104-523(-)